MFLKFPCFLYDSTNVDNLICRSSAFYKLSLYIWKFWVHILLKPSLKDFENNLTSIKNWAHEMFPWSLQFCWRNIQSFPFYCFPLFLCIVHLRRPSYLSLLFSEALFFFCLMPFSQIIPPPPSPTESKRLFYTSVSLLLSCIQGYRYYLSKFHKYVLVYCIGVFLSGLLHSV